MAKNVIILVGDGMGWEITRAAAIQKLINEGARGDTLSDFYTEGTGFGLGFQELEGYALATTGGTYIDGSKNNSALEGDTLDRETGIAVIREGYDPDELPFLDENGNFLYPEVVGFNLDEEGNFIGVDENGDPLVDENGNPIVQVGSNAPILGTFDARFDERAVFAQTADGELVQVGGILNAYDTSQGRDVPWEQDENPDYPKNLFPDSANTATTLYSAVKSYNAAIGVDIYEDDIETIGEVAREEGKSFGVVTSVPFNHATPAAAIGHVSHRNKLTATERVENLEIALDENGVPLHEEHSGGEHEGEPVFELDEEGNPIPIEDDNILYQILNETQPEVVIGGGHPDGRGDERYMDSETLQQLRNGETVYTFTERGENAAQTLAEVASGLDVEAGDKLFGLYGARGQGGNLPWSTADGDYSNAGLSSRLDGVRPLADGETVADFIASEIDANPTLAQMTSAALDVLGDDEDGFWLMVEQGDIDWAKHDNNLDNAIGAMLSLNETFEEVDQWIQDNGGYEDNLLIVTADHDHYLTLNENFPELLRTIGAEGLTTAVDENGIPIISTDADGNAIKEDNTDPVASGHYWGSDPDVKYGWAHHTTIPVPVYYQGDGAEYLDQSVGQGFESYGFEVPGIDGLIDQVHIAEAMLESVTEEETPANANSVIFIHPDGTTPSHFAAGRFASVGPDGRLNWDKMTNAGVYLGHMDDSIVGTSNGGAVVHAYGIKSHRGSYGLDEEGNPYTSLSGQEGMTIMEEAIEAGKATAVINSGFIAEPGTGVFLADVESRRDVQQITLEIVESGVDVIMGGGEIHYLPVGTVGRFGEEGIREDGRNLIQEAQAMGYTVVYTREDLETLAPDTEKVLGIFAAEDTYNDTTEERLKEQGFVDEDGNLIYYGQPGNENPPTVAEMLQATLDLDRFRNPENGMFVVLEEEATDNFGNNNNAGGTIEAVLRADAAIGVAQDYIDRTNPNTLLITAADSDGGGLEVDDRSGETVGTTRIQPPFDTRVPYDGTTGNDTAPFATGAPDANGDNFEFGVLWSGGPDVAGSIVSKTYGVNAEKLPATIDNTGIYRLMYETLFDQALDAPEGVPDDFNEITPAPEPTQKTGNVIFIHPDGTSPSHYAAARFASVGPDGRLNWDKMTDAGVYLGHMDDRLVSTSNGGAVVHAYGIKPHAGSYGLDEEGNPYTSLSGQEGMTIMEEAIAADKPTAVINSGFIAEPGTGVFLADVDSRRDVEQITLEIVESGVDVIMGGGEIHYLPVGTVGRFGEEGIREDGRNLIQEAQAMGYTVVYTREDLEALSADTEKVLGIFAAEDTYNDTTEERLKEQGFVDENGDLILYGQPGNENPPTVAEMLEATLGLDKFANAQNGFMIALEEEGSDNFPNNNNGAGAVEATLRADAAIGVAQNFVNTVNPNTLVLTAADSDAGGLEVDDTFDAETVGTVGVQSPSGIEVPRDGVRGNDTEPFVTGAPDADGDIFNFGIAYASTTDVAGSIVSKAYGLNSDQLGATVDNTDMYRLMYETLFGFSPEASKLVGFSSLPADTFEPGLPGGSGNSISSGNRDVPFAEQPVQGFSGVQFADDGNYWFLSDNGYGSKANSDDYLLRVFKVDPNFQTAEGGTGEAEVLDFIQLSDPNDFIPFDIVQEGTTERLLTGADFDIESIVVTDDRLWIGEEFGPYLLEFNLEGELLSAPIATPNFVEFDTLNGQTPLVIGHRGASGMRPEHTLEAYELAIEQGADFIEPDLVATKDGVLIARHENALAEVELNDNGEIVFDADGNPIVTAESTNVATFEKFSDRLTVKSIDGEWIGGWFSEDFTLSEIKELRARERIPNVRPDNTAFNDQFEIPTLAEIIQLVKDVEAETGKQIGIYPETKHPTYFAEEGTHIDGTPINTNLGAILVSTLVAEGFTEPDRIFIQSFEVANLIELQETILPFFSTFFGAEIVDIPLVQLLGDVEDAFINEAGGGFSVPYDIVYNFSQADFDADAALETYGELVNLVPDFGQDVTGDGLADTTYKDLATAEIFEYIGQAYAEGVGPWKNSFILRESLDTPVDGNGDGVAEIRTQLTGEVTPFVEWAHAAGMQIHPYTHRNEERYLTLNPDGTPQTPEEEIEQLIELGVDGIFTDFPGTGAMVRDQLAATEVRSPDNPDVLDGDAEANLSRSRGYEGLGYSPDRLTLYPLLEGSVVGDPDHALRIYEFDVATASFADELVGYYELADPAHAIGDMTPINDNEFIVIERDGNQGEEANFKKLFKVDLSQVDDNGFVEKTELVDLLNIADPDDLNNDGETTFSFPFVTIEDVLVLDEQTLLVANDNNYPFSIGRGPDIDNNEIITIELNEPLNLDPRVGMISEVGLTLDKTTVTEDGDTYTLTFTLDEAAPEGGLRVLWSQVDSDNELGDLVSPPTLTNASNLEQLTPKGDELARSAITIDEGATSATLTFTTVADMITEGEETNTYTLIDDIGYAPTDNSSLTVTIEDTSVEPPEVPRMVRGTSGNDDFDTENPGDSGFIGDNQLLFTGSGDDFVDVSLSPGGRRSRIDLGSGDDIIIAGSHNRIMAGSGDDSLFLGSGEGNNLVTGGSGMDEFWIVMDQEALPTNANTIADFTIGEDVIGFGNTDLSFDDLMLTQNGGNTTINALGQDLAILRRVDSADLSAADFVFA